MEENKALQVVEYSNQRILTTAQIAEVYGTTPQIISNNFNRNKDRYTAGKHYFYLEGDALDLFKSELLTKSNHQIDDQSLDSEVQKYQNVRSLYLWTEKGAWLLAKSLNTDQAWQACEMLVDEYYRIKEELTVALAAVEEFESLLDALMQGDARWLNLADTRKSIVMMMYLQRLEELHELPQLGPPTSMEQRMLNAYDTLRKMEQEKELLPLPKKSIRELSRESRKVIEALNQFDRPVRGRELAKRLGWSEEATWKQLVRMLYKDEVGLTRKGYISLVLPEDE